MEIKGDNLIAATQEQVWNGLNDPEVLRESIPGCESLEKIGDSQFKATIVIRIGPITARFSGEVELADLDPPRGYTIIGSGNAGAMGGARGKAFVSLAPEGSGTRLTYRVDADISGRIAQLGGRLIQSTAGVLAGQFFGKFANKVSGAQPSGIAAKSTTRAIPPSSRAWSVGKLFFCALVTAIIVALAVYLFYSSR